MEKYSAFRDAGTGIQPFLNPVPPNAPTLVAKILFPVGFLLGVIRVALILVVAIFYFLLELALKVFYPVAPLHGLLSWVINAILVRLALLFLGLWWISVTHITRKRGRRESHEESWTPQPGDLIVSNWASWIEILWLAFRFNPVFVLPVVPLTEHAPRTGTPTSNTPGRRTGTGSAAIASQVSRSPSIRVPVLGFRTVSLLGMLRLTGHVPPFGGQVGHARSLENIRKHASRPVVIFPECTTSNGRAMLRFAEVFGDSTVPAKGFKVFIMCVRYDPPTLYTPTLTCSIPSTSAFHPLPHIFQVVCSLSPYISQSLSIRLLNPAESPSSGRFLASDVLVGGGHKDELGEACAVLIGQLGKMRTTGQAWEDKVAFLQFYRGKTGK